MILLLDHSKSPRFNSTCLNLFLRLSFEALSRSMWCIMYACTFDQLAFEWWKKPCMLRVVSFIYSTMEFVTNQKGGQYFYGMAADLHSIERWQMAQCIGDVPDVHAQHGSPLRVMNFSSRQMDITMQLIQQNPAWNR